MHWFCIAVSFIWALSTIVISAISLLCWNHRTFNRVCFQGLPGRHQLVNSLQSEMLIFNSACYYAFFHHFLINLVFLYWFHLQFSQIAICQNFTGIRADILHHFGVSETNYLLEEKQEIRQAWLTSDKFKFSPIFHSIYSDISIIFQSFIFFVVLLKISPCLILCLYDFLPGFKEFFFFSPHFDKMFKDFSCLLEYS